MGAAGSKTENLLLPRLRVDAETPEKVDRGKKWRRRRPERF
jgi:hypothetical protein